MNDTPLTHLLTNPAANDVFTLAFLGMALLLVTVWRNFLIVFAHKMRELILSRDWRTFEAENATSGVRLRLFLSLIAILSVSIFFYQLFRFSGEVEVSFWPILIGVFAVHLVRIIITRFIENLFSLGGMYEMWIESYAWIHYIVGVLFFPLVVLLTYSPEISYSFVAHTGVVILLLAEGLLFYRLFAVFYNGIASLFYLFLYLCTLEILPLLTVFRYLS